MLEFQAISARQFHQLMIPSALLLVQSIANIEPLSLLMAQLRLLVNSAAQVVPLYPLTAVMMFMKALVNLWHQSFKTSQDFKI